MKIKFSRILGLTALLIATCAAYYSVFGLSQLFAGASIAVVIMASTLEISKIVAVSFLQRFWGKISKGLKTYLSIGVVILMIITSAGIYGFLSNAYQKTAVKSDIYEGQMGILSGKKTIFLSSIADNQKIIGAKNKRINQLTDLRTNQESRLDQSIKSGDKVRARADIDNATKEIQKLSNDIDTLNVNNSVINDSVAVYSGKEFQTKSGSAVAGELGPLKYLAELTGKPMGSVVNWFILLLIFVFDPLAIALVIATNKVLEIEKRKEIICYKPKPEDNLDLEGFEDIITEPGFRNAMLYKEVDENEVHENTTTYIDKDYIFTSGNEKMEEVILEGCSNLNLKLKDSQTIDEDVSFEEAPVVTEEPVMEDIVAEEIIKVDEPEIVKPVEAPTSSGRIKRDDIKEIKAARNFSVHVPHPKKSNNEIGRIK